MRSRWLKVRKMSQSESTIKTAPSTRKRFHFNMLVNQVLKLFASSNRIPEENLKSKNFCALPSISVTSPDGQTTTVD